jgi:glycerol-3-phosphate acyltransferase PlsX
MALKSVKTLEVVMVGDKKLIEPKINKAGLMDRVEILHTEESITCHEQPTAAIKQKPNSSVILGQSALKDREDCGAFLSAGSTGAVLTCAFTRVGRIEGVSRPALCPLLPTKDGGSVMVLDVGANMDCKPINLVHFALMANEYMKAKGIEKPRIALLNVGAEEEKGNELTHTAFKMLKSCSGINFIGNMEARDIFDGTVDAVVCDGFVGNVLLKTLGGAGSMFSYKLKQALSWVILCKIMFARRLLAMKRSLSEESVGGAIFIGIKKPVIKIHGNANAKVFCSGILFAAKAAEMNLGEQIKAAVASYNGTHTAEE